MVYRIATLVAATCCATTFAQAGDWPGFRGPHGNGLTDETDVPERWDADHNVRWKVALRQPSNGSPIVSNGRVFIAGCEDADGKRRSLYCFDRKSGEQLWTRTVDFDKNMPTHKTNPHGSTTPAANGQHVVVWHASAGLHCYDVEGHPVWSRDLGEYRHMWGSGTSPIIQGDRVFLHTGPGREVRVLAFNLATGETVWENSEPVEGDGNRRDDGQYMGSWSTPVLTRSGGRQQLICAMANRLVAYDATDGSILWYCSGLRHERGDLAYSSPILAGDICVTTGGFRGPGIGVRLGGQGDLTMTSRLWRNEKNPQSIGTGVFVDGHVYRPNTDPNTIECIVPATGESLWKSRVGSGAIWSSIVYADGRGYVTDQQGTTVVFSISPDGLKMIAANKLGETCNATLAVSDGQIFIRTHGHLYCIGK